jgi:hypothetical protein
VIIYERYLLSATCASLTATCVRNGRARLVLAMRRSIRVSRLLPREFVSLLAASLARTEEAGTDCGHGAQPHAALTPLGSIAISHVFSSPVTVLSFRKHVAAAAAALDTLRSRARDAQDGYLLSMCRAVRSSEPGDRDTLSTSRSAPGSIVT